jgi:membrane associated rhomboid family serine protease
MTIILVAILLIMLASLSVGWLCGLSVVQSGAIAGYVIAFALVLFLGWRLWAKRRRE